MLFQGQVGPQSYQSGTEPNLALGKAGELLFSEYQAKYYQLCYAGKVFQACNQANKALTSLSSTYTGHVLWLPLGTGVNSVILQCCVAVASAPAGISTMHHEGCTLVQTTAPATNTANAVSNSLLGSTAVAATASYNISTLGSTPVALRAVGGGTNATGSAAVTSFVLDDIAGGMILQPGTFVGLGYVTTAISVIASYHWAEIPV